MLSLALRMLARDWRAGELRLLAGALLVAVASVTAVELLTDRVERLLVTQASGLLGADAVIVADHPVPKAFRDRAVKLGLNVAEAIDFPSMVMVGGAGELASVRAVSGAYPLRGELRLADSLGGVDRPASGAPPPGTVWVEPRLLRTLGSRPGGRLKLGLLEFDIGAILTHEPGRAGPLFSLGPRVLMRRGDLGRTGLIQPGSRATYRLFVSGPPAAIATFRAAASVALGAGERLESVEDARPEIRSALTRGKRFLGLAAVTTVLLAGVAIAIAARRFVNRHLDSCALMRGFGARHREITALFVTQFLGVALVASAAGCALGFAGQYVLAHLLAEFVTVPLPAPGWVPLVAGMLTGVLVTLGFALPMITRLGQVPALRVLRRELGILRRQDMIGVAAGVAVYAGLLLWQAGDAEIGAYLIAGVFATFLLLGVVALILVRAAGALRGYVTQGLAFGLTNLTRRTKDSVISVLAFGLGIMVLLLMTFVRSNLLEAWQSTIPPGTPNRFLINIQPQQVDALQRFLNEATRGSARVKLYPMVRGRLVAINGEAVSAQRYTQERARRLVRREFNLSWANQLQTDNKIVAGQWWETGEYGARIVSVEEGLAETLGIHLGDELSLKIAGAELDVRVASLRSVEWDSFHPNFFILGPPGLFDEFAATYITSFHLAEQDDAVLGRLVDRFPNVTVIDIGRIISQVEQVIDNVSTAVEYVFAFTLVAGVMILFAGILSSLDERLNESALLRALGARRRDVLTTLIVEFGGLGILAGLIAASAAAVIGYLLAARVFEFAYTPAAWLWIYGALGGALVIGCAGAFGARAVLRESPMRLLREQ